MADPQIIREWLKKAAEHIRDVIKSALEPFSSSVY